MNKRKITGMALGLLVLLMVFLLCQQLRPCEIRNVPSVTVDANGFFEESFVIRNPPSDRSALIRLIDDFNKDTLPEARIRSSARVDRIFYEWTWSLTPEFKEVASPLGGTSIHDFSEEILAVVRFRGSPNEKSLDIWSDGVPVAYRNNSGQLRLYDVAAPP